MRLKHLALLIVLAPVAQHAGRVADHRRVARVRLLAAGDGVLANREALVAHVHGAALEGHRERVAVDLLQQAAARAEVHGVRAEAVGEETRQHVAHGIQSHAVALQHAELLPDEAPERVAILDLLAVRHHLDLDLLDDLVVPLVQLVVLEGLDERLHVRLPVLGQGVEENGQELRQRLHTLARVRAHEREDAAFQPLLEHGAHRLAAVRGVAARPQAGHRVPDVEAVADQRDAKGAHVLLDHVREGVVLRRLIENCVTSRRHVSPRCDRRVLGGGHAGRAV
mmetsp:Transcript_5894/g.14965  ORF Transcript_5894/g.14965 Transcript_5894/m.14965 type:complete len:281 (+) Transcript_5894:805-1647(+)